MSQCECGCGARVPTGKRTVNSQVVAVMSLIAQFDAWAQIAGIKPVSGTNRGLALSLGRLPDSSVETLQIL